jgi:hypothetical protein
MSTISEIFAQINDINGTISVLENASGTEISFADQLALSSLIAQRDELSVLLDEVTQQQKVDICDYRIIPDREGNYPVKAVAKALETFQELYTTLFASIRTSKPKHKAIFDADITQASLLNIGYAYSGSLGLVLYTHSDGLFEEDTDQDLAMRAILNFVKADSDEAIKEMADRYGRAAINKLYNWSDSLIQSGFSLDIKWKRGDRLKEHQLIQPQDLESTIEVLSKFSDETESVVTVDGILVALDIERHSFKLSFPESPNISGTFDDKFDWKIPHDVPGRYSAKLKKSVLHPVWSDKEKTNWTLLELRELK